MSYYVYILASRKDGATYVGITNDLIRRIYEHRTKAVRSFTSKYNITRLVWFEIYEDPISAISREKELKKWKRSWKTQLIEAQNPNWDDFMSRFVAEIPRCAIAHLRFASLTPPLPPSFRTQNLEIPGSPLRAAPE